MVSAPPATHSVSPFRPPDASDLVIVGGLVPIGPSRTTEQLDTSIADRVTVAIEPALDRGFRSSSWMRSACSSSAASPPVPTTEGDMAARVLDIGAQRGATMDG